MQIVKVTLIAVFSFITLSACSVFGVVNVDVASYTVLEKDQDFEVRQYEHLTFVSTSMPEGMDDASGPFRKLFGYISGENDRSEDIAMTAPVFMDQARETTETMSFVLPADFSLATAPQPKNTSVRLSEFSNFRVAVVTFSGYLNQSSVSEQRAKLQKWIAVKGYQVTGTAKAAGYNPPFTLPFLRRNEILIPIANN